MDLLCPRLGMCDVRLGEVLTTDRERAGSNLVGTHSVWREGRFLLDAEVERTFSSGGSSFFLFWSFCWQAPFTGTSVCTSFGILLRVVCCLHSSLSLDGFPGIVLISVLYTDPSSDSACSGRNCVFFHLQWLSS